MSWMSKQTIRSFAITPPPGVSKRSQACLLFSLSIAGTNMNCSNLFDNDYDGGLGGRVVVVAVVTVVMSVAVGAVAVADVVSVNG